MCVFCEIVSGNIPSTKVYEDDQILAFKDLNPVAPVHFLVVPKAHIENVNAITPDNSAVVAHIFETIPQIPGNYLLPGDLQLWGGCRAERDAPAFSCDWRYGTGGEDFMSDAYYTLHIAGLERQLKRFPVSDSMDIAAFIFFGDVELTKACAEELLKRVPEFDYIVTPEAKSIPLAYEMSRQSGKKYIVARKGVKVYMDRPEKVTVHSITTQKEQTLYLGHEDGDLLDGKRVLLLDDVISTGDSLKALQQLVALFGANIVASAAPLAEGDAADRKDIIFLEKLPLFFK